MTSAGSSPGSTVTALTTIRGSQVASAACTSSAIWARVTGVLGSIRYRRSPAPKVGRMTRSPGSVSRMSWIDWRTAAAPDSQSRAPVTGSGRGGKATPVPRR